MSPAHRKMYLHGWAHTRRILRAQGVPPAETDAHRYTIHAHLGLPKSSDDFTEADVRKVLNFFRAVAATEPEPPRPNEKTPVSH